MKKWGAFDCSPRPFVLHVRQQLSQLKQHGTFNFNGVELVVQQDDNGNPLFEVNSLCELLQYSNARDALSRHVSKDDVVKRDIIDSLGRVQKKNHVKERGMWKLLMKSNAPNAEPVQDWIAGDVLPSIRKTGSYTAPAKVATSLDSLRQARALNETEAVAARICARFPGLSEQSHQVIYAKLINPIAGHEVIPLPMLEEKFYTATEVGEQIGQNANNVGRIANANNLKTRDGKYGKFFLDKSAYSDKQVEAFRYNANGVSKLKELFFPQPANDTQSAGAA